MLQSMTAFGQSRSDETEPTVPEEFVWELRSVNHRYLDISVRLPNGFRSMENDVRTKVSQQIHRGKVEISLNLGTTVNLADELVVNTHLLSQVTDALELVHRTGVHIGPIDPVGLLQWPGLTSQRSRLDASIQRKALIAFDACLVDFTRSREREGAQIRHLLSHRAEKISHLLTQLRQLQPTVVARQRERILEKLAQLDVEHDPARLHQELVYSAQRLDIDEEIDRLESHVLECERILGRDEPVGRRLDFLMQEFNREANTVASKSSDTQTTGASIELKVLIEQMREQVQNVE